MKNNQKILATQSSAVGIKLWCGDGVVVVQKNGRTTATNLTVRTSSSKAGGSPARRGSELTTSQSCSASNINMKSISNIKNLVSAYESLKSNPGNMTPGVDPTTLDGTSLSYLKKIQEELKKGIYKFSPARRIHIPKPGKNSTRPLTIASPREKIVQKAILQVMEPYFDPKFLESSHGFRPERGTKTAIKYLDAKFQSSRYIIEADFSKAFDKIPHDKLLEILAKDIKCEKTMALLKSGLKAGFAEKGVLHESIQIGTPQGSILSPLLCNIYLNELDKFIERLKEEFNKGTKKRKSAEYTKLTNKAKY